MRIVSSCKLDWKVVNDGVNFPKAIVSWRATWLECCYPQSGYILRSPKSGLVVSDLQWDYNGGTHSFSSPWLLGAGLCPWEWRKAFISSAVIFVHLANFSLAMTSLVYLLLSVTISIINWLVKKILKTPLGDSGMAVVGPTGELNDFTSTGFSVVVHIAGCNGEPDDEVGGDDCGKLWDEGSGNGESGGSSVEITRGIRGCKGGVWWCLVTIHRSLFHKFVSKNNNTYGYNYTLTPMLCYARYNTTMQKR